MERLRRIVGTDHGEMVAVWPIFGQPPMVGKKFFAML
jgi:hypothetical protein